MRNATHRRRRFRIGRLLATPGAMRAIDEAGQDAAFFLARHAKGDWGEVCEEDKGLNEDALEHDARLLSCYRTLRNVRLWIITEADRSATTILLPEEY